ncbi:MAG: discoidin domain-containing protein, partial [Verrucomicrobia bacterium]|nr:discoidin domain-containing protein [Verrucomicrobiota bacterium]
MLAAPASLSSADFSLTPSQPNLLDFPAQLARFIRFVIHESSAAEPCLDELEVYGPDSTRNLALAISGAKATASSCLAGYAIHQIAHLNDGLYGNGHSWIAAGAGPEWAQIELPRPATISRVVFSRDREGRFPDRMPSAFEVRLSLDGKEWKTVSKVGTGLSLSAAATWDDLLRYAFLREQESWATIDPADPVTRVLKQFEAMIERTTAKGLDVSAERAEVTKLRQRQAALTSSPDAATAEAAYLEARLAKRRLFLRDPDLAPLARVLFVKRHPYEPSHNYSDILDAKWRPGGGVCVLEIPRRGERFEPGGAKVTTLFNAQDGVARDPMPGFDARQAYFAYRDSPDGYFHLFAVGADGRGLRQLTDSPFHDYYPCPLPDGGLAFISTRCKARFLCWRPQAFVLFRMDADGGNVWPLSYANISEWAPSVMRDGRILWTRSEYVDKGADFGHTLWAVRPDGTHPELVFGNNTRNCYMNGREVPGTSELCATLISHGGDLNGPIALIDLGRGRFNPEAITNITPDSPPHYNMNWAQRQCFRDPVPIARDYFLVSHAPQKHFGLYVIDRWGNRELLHLDPAMSSMCPSPLQPVAPPAVLASVAATQVAREADDREGGIVQAKREAKGRSEAAFPLTPALSPGE